ncbi:MAG: hypothetical protein K5857_06695 [Lachnospiraceae bacterium]|nr:hypothetical protein [Lachnospiraceae bacterium]
MNRKKKLTLVVVMVLSLSVFISNISGLIMAVRAADFENMEEGAPTFGEPDFNPQVPEQDAPPQEEPQGPSMEELQRQAAEEAARQEAEAARQAQEEEMRRAQEEAERLAQEEVQRQAEAARQAAEAEAARQAAEAEAARIAEAERQVAYERAAKEAEEEARKKAEADAAAEEEAKRAAEEEAKRAAEEAEKARKAAEEEAKKQVVEDPSYAIRLQIGGGSVTDIDLSAVVGSGNSTVLSTVNVGSRNIDLVYGISGATAGVFSMSLIGGSTDFKMGDMDKFVIALSPDAPVGDYSCVLYFKDAKDDANEYANYVNVRAVVTASAKVTSVGVYPQSIKLAQGSTCDFYAQVRCRDGEVSQDVKWTISGASSTGTYINGDGRLVIDSKEKSSSLKIVATSIADPSVSGMASVMVQSGSFNVNVSANPVNGGIVTGGGAVAAGGSVTLSAVPNKNFYFDGWIRDGQKVSTATNYTINDVRSTINVQASFKQNYVNVLAVPENDQAGTVVGGGRITYGGKTTISARAYDGFVFIGWKEGDSIISTQPSIDLNNLTVDRKIVARFAKTTYTLTLCASPGAGGSLSGSGTYKLGESAVIEAKPAQGYRFQNWTVNGQVVSRDASYRIERVDRDLALTAVFIKEDILTHKIMAGVATTGGTITPCGTNEVAHGGTLTYYITPKSGFAILAVAVDGIQVGPVASYTFKDIWMDHVIAAAFVQTDAGARAATASGSKPQVNKVEKVLKEEAPAVSENHVVAIEEAASGTAGDEFVQEMDLTNIEIPTDEELGITEEDPANETSNVLKNLGITMDEARMMIANGEARPILESAFYEGYLDTNVDNQYAPPTDVPDYHLMTREDLEQLPIEYLNPSFPNLDQVVEKLITPNELLAIAGDTKANITVSLRDADDTIDNKNKKLINGAVGQKPLKYFDLTMLKLVDGMPMNITELAVPLKVVIRIPDELYKKGKVYTIIRSHNDEIDVLPDLDDDPHTITFATDKFSAYAISETVASPKSIVIRFAIGAVISLLLAIACMLILMYHHVKMKRMRKGRMIK